MKGSQRGRMKAFLSQQGQSTGFEVQPVQLLAGALGIVVTVLLLHFFGKAFGA
jgi:hypothetical protein